MKPCEACSFGKAKQKNVRKDSDLEKSKVNAEQIFLDVSSARGKKDRPPVQ